MTETDKDKLPQEQAPERAAGGDERFPELAEIEEKIQSRLRSNQRFLERFMDEDFDELDDLEDAADGASGDDDEPGQEEEL
jgi:hypothetical protein